jgi:malate synthase
VNVAAEDLLAFEPESPITEAGLRNNIQVGHPVPGAWLAGNGCVPIFNLMEDAATAEISRSQVWQWMRSPKGVLDDGRKVTRELFHEMLADELHRTPSIVGADAYAAGATPKARRCSRRSASPTTSSSS